jgi:hydrogenase-4 component F
MQSTGLSAIIVLSGFLAIPAAGTLFIAAARKPKTILVLISVVSMAQAALGVIATAMVWNGKSIGGLSGILRIDMFSAWHLLVLGLAVFTPASLFAISYFERGKDLDTKKARRFGMLWLGSLEAMSLALISANIGIMWVAIEASTLFSAFLIIRDGHPASVEAMWKYIIMCSVGVAFAFIGTLLMAAAAQKAGLGGNESLLLDRIYAVRARLDPTLVLAGFVFILVGYGTKAGLAPMHNWLPDAHSQAPGPVSAMFSGFILNAALYCIVRFLPIASGAGGGGTMVPGGLSAIGTHIGRRFFPANMVWSVNRPLGILMVFAVISIVLSSIFIFFQKDSKRLLAYCSVEHMGIIAFGYALGPVGTFAALFHTLNHSLAKTVGFYSAGKLGKKLGTNDFSALAGAARAWPLWGIGLAASMLALIGMVPSGIFMSEFMLVKAAVDVRAYAGIIIVLVAVSVAFFAMLRHSIDIAWKAPPAKLQSHPPASPIEILVVVLPLAVLAVLGLWMPDTLRTFIDKAQSALWSMK